MAYRWVPVLGAPLEERDGNLIFRGGTRKDDTGTGTEPIYAAFIGLYISDQVFSGGTISAKATFTNKAPANCFDIVLNYDPTTQNTLDVGFPPYSYPLLALREYFQGKWNYLAQIGDRESALEANREYELAVTVSGSVVSVHLDYVEAIRSTLPRQYPQSQVGMLCIGHNDIVISEFKVHAQRPRAFVIMQFSAPYDDVYMEVIKRACDDLGIDVLRIDESQTPGLIISDISRAIAESTVVIADVTPINANVFYELGFAHGLNKPTILIAEKSTKLPFDVSAFRTLFYENSIGGKPRLERGLRE
ncbi:MAG TPA: hypothetical protein VK993_09055 [Chthoniobacterales bacterium]|nr:hypothetical protein [Chthoniobacterales bacterium]